MSTLYNLLYNKLYCKESCPVCYKCLDNFHSPNPGTVGPVGPDDQNLKDLTKLKILEIKNQTKFYIADMVLKEQILGGSINICIIQSITMKRNKNMYK